MDNTSSLQCRDVPYWTDVFFFICTMIVTGLASLIGLQSGENQLLGLNVLLPGTLFGLLLISFCHLNAGYIQDHPEQNIEELGPHATG